MNRQGDNLEAIELFQRIKARASTNLKTPDDVDRLRESLIRDAMAILTDAEALLGLLARYKEEDERCQERLTRTSSTC